MNKTQDITKLSKIISSRDICSRREAKELILKGYVKVDGETVKEPGLKFPNTAQIVLSEEAEELLNRKVTILVNKPVGYVSSQPEKDYIPAVQLIKASNKDPRCKIRLRNEHLKNLAPAGRLDIDSTGLLILTQNGTLAKQIISQNSEIEKEYVIRFQGQLSKESLKHLNYGLSLDGKKLKPAFVKTIGENKLQFVLKEGKKRQIRRMCELVGLKVMSLKRVRVGNIKLGLLKTGSWKFLNRHHILKNP